MAPKVGVTTEEATISARLAEAEFYRIAGTKAAFELERMKSKAKIDDAADRANQVYRFAGTVTPLSVASCISTLDEWSRAKPGCDITIEFTSPGGYVHDGLALYDVLRELSDAGHHVITKAVGYAASMAGVLMQAGDERIISKHAYFHLHEIQTQTAGGTTERDEQETMAKRLEAAILEILASKSVLSKADLKERWKKNNVWLSARQAQKLGFVDHIV